MIVDRINAYLAGQGQAVPEAILAEVEALSAWAFKRQFGVREERTNKQPYFSSIGKCLRQQAYDLLGFEKDGKPIDARSKMVFFQGDMVELAVIELAKLAGCDIRVSGFEQQSVEWEGLRGRPDGVLAGTHLVEVKSMSSYAFESFERGTIDDSYRYQCNAGMEALGLEKTVILALNKDAGVLGELAIDKDPAIIADIRHRLKILNSSTQENLPERPYVPNDQGFLPWQCRFCGWYKHCWPSSELILSGRSYKLWTPQKEKTTTTTTQKESTP